MLKLIKIPNIIFLFTKKPVSLNNENASSEEAAMITGIDKSSEYLEAS